MDKIVLQVGENKTFAYLSRIITETGAGPNTVFWKAINIADLGIDIIGEEKAVFTVNRENEKIHNKTHYPVALVDLEFSTHSNIAEKIEGLKALRKLSGSGSGNSSDAGGGVAVPALGEEYKTGRTVSGREEFARQYTHTHPGNTSISAFSSLNVWTIPEADWVAVDPSTAFLNMLYYANTQGQVTAPAKFSARLNTPSRNVDFVNHFGNDLGISADETYTYELRYLKLD